MNAKDERLASFCRERAVDGVWIRRRANIAWATDGADVHCNAASELGVASLLWTPERKLVLCDNIEGPRMRAEEFFGDWEIGESRWWEPGRAPRGKYASDWPDDALVDLRAPLTELEVERARELGRDTAEVMRGVMFEIRRGTSELEIAGSFAGKLRARAIGAPVILVAADERIERFRHPIATEKRCERALMLVVCAERRGLIVALTRLVHFGALPAVLRRKHDAVCKVDAALHTTTKPGMRWCDLLEVAQLTYAIEGFADEWQKHHQGGPMGYAPRDFVATPSETRAVRERQLVGWNPSITGTKSEDTILSGGEVLTAMSDWPTCGTRPDILVRT
jgi:Xaa-Pro aminopeptidase